MAIEIQVFEKGPDRIVLAWDEEDTSTIKSFNVYISLIPGTGGFSVVSSLVPNRAANDGITKGRVGVIITESDIQALGGGFASATFESTQFFFRATTINIPIIFEPFIPISCSKCHISISVWAISRATRRIYKTRIIVFFF